jgi:hypothetical protein
LLVGLLNGVAVDAVSLKFTDTHDKRRSDDRHKQQQLLTRYNYGKSNARKTKRWCPRCAGVAEVAFIVVAAVIRHGSMHKVS